MILAVDYFVHLHVIGTIPRESTRSLPTLPNRWHDCYSVRQAIRNHDIVLEADKFPRFLWEGERANTRDLKKGFLRGEILVRVCHFTLVDSPHTHQYLTGNVIDPTWTLRRRDE